MFAKSLAPALRCGRDFSFLLHLLRLFSWLIAERRRCPVFEYGRHCNDAELQRNTDKCHTECLSNAATVSSTIFTFVLLHAGCFDCFFTVSIAVECLYCLFSVSNACGMFLLRANCFYGLWDVCVARNTVHIWACRFVRFGPLVGS